LNHPKTRLENHKSNAVAYLKLKRYQLSSQKLTLFMSLLVSITINTLK